MIITSDAPCWNTGVWKKMYTVDQEVYRCVGPSLCRNELFYHDKQIISDMIPDIRRSDCKIP